jgi:ABC-type nitrate/sulfonate/bicarbonate transport system ATPase subunit
MLSIRDCSTGYADATLFADLTLHVAAGEVVVVVGRSGVGKTTLLHIAAGIHTPRRGQVTLDGRPLEAGDRRVGMVQQHFGLFPWLTVGANVALGLRLRGVPRSDHARRAHAALREVGLEDRRDAYPGELSGGERQRVALARTRSYHPRLLLLDEPFSALDAITREELQEDFMRLQLADGPAALLVTHSLEEAVFLSHRIGILRAHPLGFVMVENPWNRPFAERRHGHRGDADFLHAVGRMRHHFEDDRRG